MGPYNNEIKRSSYDDASLCDLRYSVFEIMQKSSAVSWTWKFGYSAESQRRHFERKVVASSVATVSSKTPLIEIMRQFDLFVLEIPSTTLSELALMKKPMLVFADEYGMSLTQLADETLSQSCFVAKSRLEFLTELAEINERGRSSATYLKCRVSHHVFVETFVNPPNTDSLGNTTRFMLDLLQRGRA